LIPPIDDMIKRPRKIDSWLASHLSPALLASYARRFIDRIFISLML
jgi:hypothetical protein